MTEKLPAVLIFTSSFPHARNPVYGIFIHDFVMSLRAFCRVVVLAPKFPGPRRDEMEEGIRIHSFPQCCPPGCCLAGRPGGILPALKKNPFLWLFLPCFLLSELICLARTVKKENIRVIHAHWLLPQGFIGAVYKRFFNRRVKLIITCHGSDVHKVGGGMMNRLKRFAIKNADRVVAVSASMAEKISKLCPTSQCAVQPMGINTDLFSPAAAAAPSDIMASFRLKTPPVLFVGSLIELKGVRELVTAWPKVKKHRPDAELLIVGEGELKTELIESARSSGVEDSIHFAGMVPHDRLPQIFARSAVFVLPSHSEGFPLVVLEALACGTATVVSHLPVFDSLPGADGLFTFCEIGDPESIAAAIIESLSSPGDGERRRRYVCENLSQRRVAERYFRFYSELPDGKAD